MIAAAQIAVIGGIFYLLLFRPMQKQKQDQKKMLEELKPGDAVVTTGGITGSITAIESDTIVIRVKPDNVKLQFARSAVTSIVSTEVIK